MNAHTTVTPAIPTESNHVRSLQRCDGIKPKAWGKSALLSSPTGWYPMVEIAFDPACTEKEFLAVMVATRTQALTDLATQNRWDKTGGKQKTGIRLKNKTGADTDNFSDEQIASLSEGFTDCAGIDSEGGAHD